MLKKSIKTWSMLLLFVALFSLSALAQDYSPSQSETDAARKSGPCTDAWITIAYKREWNRKPIGYGNIGECNISLYNGGSWDSYSALYHYVNHYVNQMKQANAKMDYVKIKDTTDIRIAFFDGSSPITLVDQTNVANLIGRSSANLISLDGSGLVSRAGGSFSIVNSNTYSTQSGAKKVIKLGKTSIVIK